MMRNRGWEEGRGSFLIRWRREERKRHRRGEGLLAPVGV
jgi:hypothetical protein